MAAGFRRSVSEPDSGLRGNLLYDIMRKSDIASVNGLFMDNSTSEWLTDSNATNPIPEGGYGWNDTGPAPGQTGS